MRVIYPNGEISEPYSKQILVPFGEFVPCKNIVYNISDTITEYLSSYDNYTHGKESNVINSDIGKLGGIICYESVYPNIIRSSVNNGAELLLVISNDSWFGDTSALYQHLSHSVLRAV